MTEIKSVLRKRRSHMKHYSAPPAGRPEPKETSNSGRCCPECGNSRTGVFDSRADSTTFSKPTVKRRHQCYACSHRWVSFQITEADLDAIFAAARASESAAIERVIAIIAHKLKVPLVALAIELQRLEDETKSGIRK